MPHALVDKESSRAIEDRSLNKLNAKDVQFLRRNAGCRKVAKSGHCPDTRLCTIGLYTRVSTKIATDGIPWTEPTNMPSACVPPTKRPTHRAPSHPPGGALHATPLLPPHLSIALISPSPPTASRRRRLPRRPNPRTWLLLSHTHPCAATPSHPPNGRGGGTQRPIWRSAPVSSPPPPSWVMAVPAASAAALTAAGAAAGSS